MLYLNLRLFHILFMATWFGAMLFAPGDAKRAIAAGPEHLSLLRDRMRRAGRVSSTSAFLTVASGVALIFSMGGMGAVPVPIHIGLLGGIIGWVLTGVFSYTWKQIDAGIESGTSAQDLAPLAKRLSMIAGMFHLSWLGTLVLMVYRNNLM